MKDKLEKFFPTTPSVVKRSTVGILCTLLVGLFIAVSCEDLKPLPPIPSNISVWEYISEEEPQIIITLSFDSLQNRIYVNSTRDTVRHMYAYAYMCDGCQFYVKQDSLYTYKPNYSQYPCYAITYVSSDTMELEYFGGGNLASIYIKEYLFHRKK